MSLCDHSCPYRIIVNVRQFLAEDALGVNRNSIVSLLPNRFFIYAKFAKPFLCSVLLEVSDEATQSVALYCD